MCELERPGQMAERNPPDAQRWLQPASGIFQIPGDVHVYRFVESFQEHGSRLRLQLSERGHFRRRHVRARLKRMICR
ncbi:uncharacterized protein THITE_2115025 [Thermothielavioides terrestris NRRL 8126]|uniref:Uncharacterized protein n=1 Tax=Thermothielavioides terrestris (strain ATCC 38088 / NRRL 8126) TaxID=578455 RepID=G2R2N2_THETT|nr:uncharacterized protein THITE_2115025 [Thermothielavioides terrestris NRRL 8126]AEO66708.1 hypothetical protein THITE_2115025 [Thermothielavioides terrestris NRRL 8126]